MAVTLRLARHGSTHRPFYHVVAADSRKRLTGRYLEKVGYYDPSKNPSLIELKEDRVQHWYGLGASMSNTVDKLIKAKKLKLERNKTPAK
jgi:small subunit ribosomal protein S16